MSACIEALRKLAATPIAYSPDDKCFVLPDQFGNKKRKRGLTTVIRELMPVPHGELTPEEEAAAKPKRARKSKNDPQPNPTIWRNTDATRHHMQHAAPTCRDSTCLSDLLSHPHEYGRAGIGPAYNKRHGSVVDEQLLLRVSRGRAALTDRTLGPMRGGLDPCTATILDYLRAQKQRIVAAQVPLHSAEMDVATAFDIMVDDGTIYEVKSTVVTTPEQIERGNKSYETPRARLRRTGLRGTPCSQYSLGQLQLYITASMVHETTGWRPPKAAVLRVSPNLVRRYDLNPWFDSRSVRFRRAIAQRTGQHKRNKRTRRHTIKLS